MDIGRLQEILRRCVRIQGGWATLGCNFLGRIHDPYVTHFGEE